MTKNIDAYNENYLISKKGIEKTIKAELIDFKSNFKNFDHTHNTISQTLYQESKKSIVYQSPYEKLTRLFEKRFDTYERSHSLIILDREILDGHSSLENPDITFDQYLKEIAHNEALKDCITLFSNGRDIFKLMYDLNNFEDFKLEDYGSLYYTTDLFIKLHKQLYPEKYQSKNEEESTTTKPTKISFGLRPNSRSALANSFTFFKDILNDEDEDKAITRLEFRKIFEEPFTSNKHKLYFTISNASIRELVLALRPHFTNLTFQSIENSGKFINSMGKPLNANDFSKVTENQEESHLIAKIISCIEATITEKKN